MNALALDKLRQQMIALRLDGLLIAKKANTAYLSGLRGEGLLLITPRRKIILTDFRFKEQAAQEAKSWQTYSRPGFQSLSESLARLASKLKLRRLGFEALAISYELYSKLKRALEPVTLVPTTDLVEQLRAIKTPAEIKLLKKAAACAVQSYLYARKIIRAGQTEKDLAGKIACFMQKQGAQRPAFEMIVASGKRSALPHGQASDKIIRANEAVLLDLGCRVAGYNSDLTRMLFLGRMKPKLKRIYDLVFQAQQLAIQAIKAGEEIARVDGLCRQHIARAGFGACFGHALGHGVGLEVHELPAVSPKNQDVFKEGMVLTVEPAIYLPGWGGVRIEDMVLVKKNGCEVLTTGT